MEESNCLKTAGQLRGYLVSWCALASVGQNFKKQCGERSCAMSVNTSHGPPVKNCVVLRIWRAYFTDREEPNVRVHFFCDGNKQRRGDELK